ncbi:MAG: Asp-tRNA(Asn)/Glu-tRNA(Gln) amidotransferase subunit GatC [Pseudomonadota bacterium]
MSIDADTVRKVAHLARIRVEEAEIETLAGELSSILDWVEELQAVNVEGIEPMTAVNDLPLPRRIDGVTAAAGEEGLREDALANAPAAREGFYAVPKVVE